MPSTDAVDMMRTATSPRLATSSRLIMRSSRAPRDTSPHRTPALHRHLRPPSADTTIQAGAAPRCHHPARPGSVPEDGAAGGARPALVIPGVGGVRAVGLD